MARRGTSKEKGSGAMLPYLVSRVVEDGYILRRTGELIEQGCLKEAEELCQAGLKAQPDAPRYWGILGEIETKRGRKKAANHAWTMTIEAIHASNETTGPCAELDGLEAELQFMVNHPENAQAPLERLVELEPDRADLLMELGVAYSAREQFVEARIAWERAYHAAKDPTIQGAVLEMLLCLSGVREEVLGLLDGGGISVEGLAVLGEEKAAYAKALLQAGDLAQTPSPGHRRRSLFNLDFIPKGGYWGWDDQGRVTIARAFINSTGGDYIVFWAQRCQGGGFEYGAYETACETEGTVPIKKTDRPLTLGELFWQMEATEMEEEEDLRGVGPLKAALLYNLESSTPAELINFVQVESNFYPEAPGLFRYILRRFLLTRGRGSYTHLRRRRISLRSSTIQRIHAYLRSITLLHGQLVIVRREWLGKISNKGEDHPDSPCQRALIDGAEAALEAAMRDHFGDVPSPYTGAQETGPAPNPPMALLEDLEEHPNIKGIWVNGKPCPNPKLK